MKLKDKNILRREKIAEVNNKILIRNGNRKTDGEDFSDNQVIIKKVKMPK